MSCCEVASLARRVKRVMGRLSYEPKRSLTGVVSEDRDRWSSWNSAECVFFADLKRGWRIDNSSFRSDLGRCTAVLRLYAVRIFGGKPLICYGLRASLDGWPPCEVFRLVIAVVLCSMEGGGGGVWTGCIADRLDLLGWNGSLPMIRLCAHDGSWSANGRLGGCWSWERRGLTGGDWDYWLSCVPTLAAQGWGTPRPLNA
jgi:hypothetical protein